MLLSVSTRAKSTWSFVKWGQRTCYLLKANGETMLSGQPWKLVRARLSFVIPRSWGHTLFCRENTLSNGDGLIFPLTPQILKRKIKVSKFQEANGIIFFVTGILVLVKTHPSVFKVFRLPLPPLTVSFLAWLLSSWSPPAWWLQVDVA